MFAAGHVTVMLQKDRCWHALCQGLCRNRGYCNRQQDMIMTLLLMCRKPAYEKLEGCQTL